MNFEENSDDNSDRNIRNLIDGSAEIAGGAIGGALGFLAGGPLGAAALGVGGVIAAKTIKYIGNEVSSRLLGPREKVRIGGVIAIAADMIDQRLKSGEILRDDGFFDEKQRGRSAADEVVENILLKSQREPEEKKIRHMGMLLANIAFDTTISAALAHQIIKGAEQLTYRQLCLLKLSVANQNGLRKENYRLQSSFQKELYQVLFECMDLYSRGLISFGGEVAFGPTDVEPNKMKIQGLGSDIYNLMSLRTIPITDLLPLAAILE